MANVELTAEALKAHVLKLSVADRLRLMDEIWDSLDPERAPVALSESQSNDLDQRVERWRANPQEGISLEQWKAKYLGAS